MKRALVVAASFFAIGIVGAFADEKEALTTPESGVLCDRYICADRNGISVELTKKHLGEAAANKLTSQGEFDMTRFTLANGVFCDTEEKACHVDRYFDADGKRSAIDGEATASLFGE